MLDRVNTSGNLNLSDELVAKFEYCIEPAETAFCIPPICYSSDEHLARETELIFRKKWIGIVHAAGLKAGDYETMDIDGVPIIVLRDKEGQASGLCQLLSPSQRPTIGR